MDYTENNIDSKEICMYMSLVSQYVHNIQNIQNRIPINTCTERNNLIDELNLVKTCLQNILCGMLYVQTKFNQYFINCQDNNKKILILYYQIFKDQPDLLAPMQDNVFNNHHNICDLHSKFTDAILDAVEVLTGDRFRDPEEVVLLAFERLFDINVI